jgi:hypothetical protein
VAAGRPDSSNRTRCVVAVSRSDDKNMSNELSHLPKLLESKTTLRTLTRSRSPEGVRACAPSLRTDQSPCNDTSKAPSRTEDCQPGRPRLSMDDTAGFSVPAVLPWSALVEEGKVPSMIHRRGWSAPSCLPKTRRARTRFELAQCVRFAPEIQRQRPDTPTVGPAPCRLDHRRSRRRCDHDRACRPSMPPFAHSAGARRSRAR